MDTDENVWIIKKRLLRHCCNSRFNLHVKQEVDDVAVLHHVVLALAANQTLGLGVSLNTVSPIQMIMQRLQRNTTVRMDKSTLGLENILKMAFLVYMINVAETNLMKN